MPPTVPINHYLGPRNQQNRTEVLSYYSMLQYSERQACLKHSIFLKVKVPEHLQTQLSATSYRKNAEVKTTRTPIREAQDDQDSTPTKSFLTDTTIIYTISTVCYAAA